MILRILYLPYENFRKSIASYSDDILSLTLETLWQVRNSLRTAYQYDIPYGHFEIWKAWHNWPQALVRFYLLCFEEARGRGLSYSHREYEHIKKRYKSGRFHKPAWIGWKELHSEHRANLLFFGTCEVVASRICRSVGEKPSMLKACVRGWLLKNGFPREMLYFEPCDVLQASSVLDEDGYPDPPIENHYRQFPWKETPTPDYSKTALDPDASYLC